jgi:hypothetical protein
MTEDKIKQLLESIGCKKIKNRARSIISTCPKGENHKRGYDRNPSFSVFVNNSGGSYCKCFACGFEGILEKMAISEWGLKGYDSPDFSGKSLLLMRYSRLPRQMISSWAKKAECKDKSDYYYDFLPESSIDGFLGEIPRYILDRGISIETARYWNIGFDKKNARAIFVTRDERGRLRGVSGRSVGDRIPKYCIRRDSIIITGRGCIEAGAVVVGDKVWSFNEKEGKWGWSKIVNKWNTTSRVVKVSLRNGQEVFFGFNHKVWCWKKGKWSWVHSQELSRDDFMYLAPGWASGDNVADLWWWLVGAFCGDGYRESSRTIVFGFDKNVKYWRESLKKAAKVSGLKFVERKPCGDTKWFAISGDRIRALDCIGSRPRRSKSSSWFVPTMSSRSEIVGFIRGVFDADGSSADGKVRIGLNSECAIDGIMLLLQSVGVFANKKRSKCGSFVLTMCGEQAVRFANSVGFGINEKQKAIIRHYGSERKTGMFAGELLREFCRESGVGINPDALAGRSRVSWSMLRMIASTVRDRFESAMLIHTIRDGMPVAVDGIEFLSEEELVDFETEAKTFVNNGLLVHNCHYNWDIGEYKLKPFIDWRRESDFLRFKKGNFLFGEHLIEESRGDVFLVEGHIDAVIMWQYGYNAVATMGTGFSDEQILRIVRCIPVNRGAVIMFDGDKAGKDAMVKLRNLIAKKIQVKVIELPDECDPGGMSKKEVTKEIENIKL